MDALKKAQEAKTQGQTEGPVADAAVDTAKIDDAEFAAFMAKKPATEGGSDQPTPASSQMQAPASPISSVAPDLSLSLDDTTTAPSAPLGMVVESEERSVVKTYAPKHDLGLQLDTTDAPLAPPPTPAAPMATAICDDVLSELEKDLAKQPQSAHVPPPAAIKAEPPRVNPPPQAAEKPSAATAPAQPVQPKPKAEHPRQAARILAASAKPASTTPWLRTALFGGGALLLVGGLGGGYFYYEYQKLNTPMMARLPPPLPAPLQEGFDGEVTEDTDPDGMIAARDADTQDTVLIEPAPTQATQSATATPAAAVEKTPKAAAPVQGRAATVPAETPPTAANQTTSKSTVSEIPAEKPRPPVEVKKQEPQESVVYRDLTAAYEAYQAGNTQRASELYRNVLTHMPENRDALLGLAAVSHKTGQPEQARALYQQALRRNKYDSVALAGWYGVMGEGDPTAVESELKVLLAKEGEVAYLQFALGNAYARQGKWTAAEQAFAAAYRLDPANADYAYNLAVTYDQLGQSSAALRHYDLALSLNRGGVSFDREQVTRRLEQLRVGH